MGCLHGAHRHAALLVPERLDASSAAEHPVRLLEAWVAPLPLTLRGCQRAPPRPRAGRPRPRLIWCRCPGTVRSLASAVQASSGTGDPAAGRVEGAVKATPA